MLVYNSKARSHQQWNSFGFTLMFSITLLFMGQYIPTEVQSLVRNQISYIEIQTHLNGFRCGTTVQN